MFFSCSPLILQVCLHFDLLQLLIICAIVVLPHNKAVWSCFWACFSVLMPSLKTSNSDPIALWVSSSSSWGNGKLLLCYVRGKIKGYNELRNGCNEFSCAEDYYTSECITAIFGLKYILIQAHIITIMCYIHVLCYVMLHYIMLYYVI